MMNGFKPNKPKWASCGWSVCIKVDIVYSLTVRHPAAQRKWAAEHQDWMQSDWVQVLFTDESGFSLECDARRVCVCRGKGTRNNQIFV
ncbi:hypothetical protein TNCV_814451 [Trichonephila clavipes]|nr:hypothetical protein TNCV_814451 [Trichonephila clavipes]